MKEQLAPARGLWHRAPALRYACWLGFGLTALAVVLPLLHRTPEEMNGDAGRAKAATPFGHPVLANRSPATPSQSSITANPGEMGAQQAPGNSRSGIGAKGIVMEPIVSPRDRTIHTPSSHVARQNKPANMPTKSGVLGGAQPVPSTESAHPATQPPIANVAPSPLPEGRPQEAAHALPPLVSSGALEAERPTGEDAFLGGQAAPIQKAVRHCENVSREPIGSVTPGATEGRLPAEGISCFFNGAGVMYDVRMDLPFAQPIDGIRIGDTADGVTQKLGAPSVQRPFGNRMSYIYYPTPMSFERFDVQDGIVRTIFIGSR
jgi:hypothetical protein